MTEAIGGEPTGGVDTPASKYSDDDGGVPAAHSLVEDHRLSSGTAKALLSGLGWLDRLLSVFIILSMIIGIVIGEFATNAKENLNVGSLNGVSAPLVIGLIFMMWPILTKVQYERLPDMLKTRRLWIHIATSLILNWVIGPFLMLGLAWATLPDLEPYRTGVIMVGLGRCVAMVMIWNHIARGDADVCAVIVIINAILQLVLYAPFGVWFINIISGSDDFRQDYNATAIAVLIYLGIPLTAGVFTRFSVIRIGGKKFLEEKFLPLFGPISLVGLLFTIIIIFAEQARSILHNLGPTFRTLVPLVLYFAIMWILTFVLIWQLSIRYGKATWGYRMAVVQAFTASSNNFELAIAVCISTYGADSEQALAATIGPLVEVPVLLCLSWVALYIGQRLRWDVNAAKPADHVKMERVTVEV